LSKVSDESIQRERSEVTKETALLYNQLVIDKEGQDDSQVTGTRNMSDTRAIPKGEQENVYGNTIVPISDIP
jgi:hypothetical protein